jgi:hypothetical protein
MPGGDGSLLHNVSLCERDTDAPIDDDFMLDLFATSQIVAMLEVPRSNSLSALTFRKGLWVAGRQYLCLLSRKFQGNCRDRLVLGIIHYRLMRDYIASKLGLTTNCVTLVRDFSIANSDDA